MKYLNIQYFLALIFSLLVASSVQASQPLASISSVAAGGYHTCALTTAGGVKCWGWNNEGQLGDNTIVGKRTPVDVVGLSSGVSAIAAGEEEHTCALTTAGGVKCWGLNYDGQLGDNTTTQRLTPVDVAGLSSGVSAIAAGYLHTCALTTAGAVKCWGANYPGELGDSTTTNRFTPVDVVGLSSGVSAIAAGYEHTCAVTTAGGVKCWGDNDSGQLGDGTTMERLTPADVVGLSSGVSAISAGWDHTCALTTTGGVKCWGRNSEGELGDSTTTNRFTPVDVVGLSSGVSAVAAGYYHTCALTTVGTVKCWGSNLGGQLGDNQASENQSSLPVDVVGLSSGVSVIAAGGAHTCALTTVGDVKCWGYNFYGQLGDGTTTDRYTPVDVLAFKPTKNNFDGDGESDVLFINASSGSVRYWGGANKKKTTGSGTLPVNYSYAGTGDFNGDGKADLLFIKSSNNATLIWSGAKKSAASYPGAGAAGFSVAAICDTNGDGKDDIVWYNATTGKTQIWPSATKAGILYPGSGATGFSVVACGDFDGDGKADLFWRNATTGADQIWNGASKGNMTYPGTNADLTMTVVGVGDIDGDGKSDLIWYKPANGAINVWKGGLKSAASYLGANTTAFTPKAIGDYDGDGKADLLWGNDTTLATEIWYGFVKSAAKYPGTSLSGFSIQQ